MNGDDAELTPKIEIFGASPALASAASGTPASNAAPAKRACRRDTGLADMVTVGEDVMFEHVESLVPENAVRGLTAGPLTNAGVIVSEGVERVNDEKLERKKGDRYGAGKAW